MWWYDNILFVATLCEERNLFFYFDWREATSFSATGWQRSLSAFPISPKVWMVRWASFASFASSQISQTRSLKVIEAIAAAVRATQGATLLDVDPGQVGKLEKDHWLFISILYLPVIKNAIFTQSTNRTVFTFVGDPTSVVEAALAAAKVKMEMFFIANVTFVVSPTSLVIIFSFHKGCLRKDWHAEAHRGTSKVSWEDPKIDWNSNEHRMGALDVCPFIPISGVTEEECVQVSKNFGARLGKEVSHLSFPTIWSFPALCASVPVWCCVHSRLQVFARM